MKSQHPKLNKRKCKFHKVFLNLELLFGPFPTPSPQDLKDFKNVISSLFYSGNFNLTFPLDCQFIFVATVSTDKWNYNRYSVQSLFIQDSDHTTILCCFEHKKKYYKVNLVTDSVLLMGLVKTNESSHSSINCLIYVLNTCCFVVEQARETINPKGLIETQLMSQAHFLLDGKSHYGTFQVQDLR